MEETRECFEAALAISREVGHRLLEGHVLGDLGQLHAKTGCFEEARVSLAEGEKLMREVGDLLQLGNFLCQRSRCEHLAGDTAAASKFLAEAEALAEQTDLGPDSDLGREITKLRQALEDETSPVRKPEPNGVRLDEN